MRQTEEISVTLQIASGTANGSRRGEGRDDFLKLACG
jgi:hypothetical protein